MTKSDVAALLVSGIARCPEERKEGAGRRERRKRRGWDVKPGVMGGRRGRVEKKKFKIEGEKKMKGKKKGEK